jgi:NAD(P)-dependent dehydrogenase (short-subunit alcohol dehydrogenase family)
MKTAIVTGTSRGIGKATAELFLQKSWKVIGTYNNNATDLESPNFVSLKLDLGSKESIATAVEEIKKESQTIDALVNNAGICVDGQTETLTMENLRETFEVDLFGQVDFTEQLIPLLQEDSRIINVDSIYGAQSFPINDKTHPAYRIAKAAFNMYSRVLAFKLKDQGVIVSAIDPGWVKTDMGLKSATETDSPDREPEEVAQEIYDLATKDIESGFFWLNGKKRDW